ncbi:MAG TPA: F0F1 ATP synthase subunit delta [Gammaproteobacteria bacterium]|nr:F0F1 ATP synthase subunit delta [Gammaproteobacteria bacterium]
MADDTTIARPYAKALFDVANAGGKLGSWSDALHAAAAVLGEASAKRVLANPALDQGKRAEFIRAVSVGLKGADVLETAQGKALLALLAENDRLTMLPEIAVQFDALKAEAENKVKATLTSATAVDAAVAERVKQALKKRLGREVELELKVDPSLIGGAIVQAEDMVIDGSVRTRLEQLARAMVS